jgi:hypothetical protein
MHRTALLAVVWILSNTQSSFGQSTSGIRGSKPCGQRLAILAGSTAALEGKENVVEVRACEAGVLQLVAIGNSIITVETNRTSVVSAVFVSDVVFAIQTAGASSNMVHVIVFDNGVPHVALIRSVKAYAQFSVSWKTLTVSIPVAGGRFEKHEFPTKLE